MRWLFARRLNQNAHICNKAGDYIYAIVCVNIAGQDRIVYWSKGLISTSD